MIYNVLLVVQIIISVAIIALVLLQQGKGADAGAAFGAGASGTVFGARGSGNFMSRSTAILATIFFVNCLALAWLVAEQTGSSSVTSVLQSEQSVVSEEVPAATEVNSEVPTAPKASE